MFNKKRVAIIGGAGHVGLGMCLVLAEVGHDVIGIDINDDANALIMSGTMPFMEDQGQDYLDRALLNKRLHMTADFSAVSESDVVVIVMGTPIDENLNPRFDGLKKLFANLGPFLRKGQLVVLRSTVSPGTTERVRRMLERQLGWRCGEDIHLVFAPERVLQGKSIEELESLPQIVGVFDDAGWELAREFFATYVRNEIPRLTPVEAEIGKLVTNMYRYLTFAFANEVFLISDQWGANSNKVIDAINKNYPRVNVPRPGPNVGGPCLFKDGYFLIERMPFPDLISTSFKINEGMTAQIAMKIDQMPEISKIGILGLTFKANNDDTRNSLSYKLRKQLDDGSYEVISVDPYVDGHKDIEELEGADCVVLMTPHREFADLTALARAIKNPDCIVIDIWGFWSSMRYLSDNGVFVLKEAFETSYHWDNDVLILTEALKSTPRFVTETL